MTRSRAILNSIWGPFTLLKKYFIFNLRLGAEGCLLTLFNERLFDPTSVVLNSFPAGDCVGDGRYTIVPALGLM